MTKRALRRTCSASAETTALEWPSLWLEPKLQRSAWCLKMLPPQRWMWCRRLPVALLGTKLLPLAQRPRRIELLQKMRPPAAVAVAAEMNCCCRHSSLDCSAAAAEWPAPEEGSQSNIRRWGHRRSWLRFCRHIAPPSGPLDAFRRGCSCDDAGGRCDDEALRIIRREAVVDRPRD